MPDTWTPVFDVSDLDAVSDTNRKAEVSISNVAKAIRKRETGVHVKGRYPKFAIQHG